MLLDDAGEPLAGDRADTAAAFLHREQQRHLIKRGPELAEAELRAGLRIGRDARGIVIRGAGDEAGTDDVEEGANAGARLLLRALDAWSAVDTKDGARMLPFRSIVNLILCCGDGNLRAHFLDALARDPRRDDADAIGGAGDHMPPRIDDERMTIGRARTRCRPDAAPVWAGAQK